jgi:hypothetical protein
MHLQRNHNGVSPKNPCIFGEIATHSLSCDPSHAESDLTFPRWKEAKEEKKRSIACDSIDDFSLSALLPRPP